MSRGFSFLFTNRQDKLKKAGRNSIILRAVLPCLILLVLAIEGEFIPNAEAVSCTPGSGLTNAIIGTQYVANKCPGASFPYSFTTIDLACTSIGNNQYEIIEYSGSSGRYVYSTSSPTETLTYVKLLTINIGDKIFGNSAGTNFVSVNSRFNGTLDGISPSDSSYITKNSGVNYDVFDKVLFVNNNVGSKYFVPPCCIDIPSPQVKPAKPTVSELIPIKTNVTANYPVTWQLSVNNIVTTGTDTSLISFNGKLQNGDPFLPGIYDATLTIKSPGCADVPTTFQVTTTEPPNDSTCFGCFGSDANLAGGALTHSDQIISTNSGLLPLALSIDYNSQDASTGSLGPNWRHSLDITLSDAGHDALLLRSGGTKRLYTYSSGTYSTPPGDHGTLTGTPGGTHILSYPNGTVFNFTADGKISTITDRYHNQLVFDYPGGTLATVTDSNGQKLTFTHSGGWLQSVNDPKGNLFTFTPHPPQTPQAPQDGKLWKVVNPLSNTDNVQTYFEYTYNAANGLLQSRRDPNGNTTQYTYNTDSVTNTKRARTSIDPDGASNSAYHTRMITYPPTPTTPSSEDTQILTTSVVEKDGGNWNYSYDVKKGALTSVSNTDTNTTTKYYYDTFGNLIAITAPYNGTTRLTTFYSYDGNGNILTETDPIDISVSVYPSLQEYDLSLTYPSFLANLTPPINTAVSYAWDGFSRITQISNVRDTTALTTNITYTTEDVTNLELTTITDQENNITKIRRDPNSGRVMEIEDGNYSVTGKKTVFTYYPNVQNDAKSGQLKDITGPDSVKTSFTDYDWNGNPKGVAVFDKDGVQVPVDTTLAYDALNRLRTITRNLTAQSKILTHTADYDQYGSLTAKDPEQNANSTAGTRYDFNYNSKVKQITDALTHVTTLAYGGQNGGIDQLTAVKDPRQTARGASGKSTQFQYDKLGRVDRDIDPSGRAIHYTYYDNGLLKEKYDATSAYPGTLLMSYTYNNRGLLLSKTRNDGGNDQYTYKTNGFLNTATTTVKNPDNSFSTLISFSFDWYKNGWLKSVKDITAGLPGTPIADYDLYDGIGQRKTVTFFSGTADQHVVTYDYDTANRPWHIKDDFGTSGNSADDITFTFDYDNLGRRWHLEYPGLNPVIATYLYDDLDRLTSISHQIQGGAVIASVAYPTLDGADNRKSKTTDITAESYIYDLLYRIYQTVTSVGTEQFLYDDAGNRTSGPGPMDTRYQTDPDTNLMTKGRLLDYGYDNRGNQTTRTVPNTTDKAWIQSWDSEDRLVKVEKTKQILDTNGVLQRTDKRTVTFSYDPFGRRIGKTFSITRGSTQVAGGIWRFIYDNDDIVLETYTELNKAAEKTFFIHGPGIDEPLALERGGQYYTYHADGLGSIVSIADQNNAVVERYSYDTYGMTTPEFGFRNTYTFTGRELDKEVGLLYYRLRYRDLLDGDFIGKDPAGFAAGDVNLWSYVLGNPGNWVDPDGLSPSARNLYDVDGVMAGSIGGGGGGLLRGSGTLSARSRGASSQSTTGFLSNVTVKSHGNVVGRGTVDLRSTLCDIQSGKLKPRDAFRNREGLLPKKPDKYYEEFVHPTLGVKGAGSQRIVRGKGGELYYTPDHYKSFIPLN